jgi:hypothetical protein
MMSSEHEDTSQIDVLRRVVTELEDVALTRSHRDDLLCMETGIIIQEAHVQLVEHLANVKEQESFGNLVVPGT